MGEGQDIHVDLRKAWIEQSPWQKDAMPYTLINGVSKAWNSNVFVLNPGFARSLAYFPWANPQCSNSSELFYWWAYWCSSLH